MPPSRVGTTAALVYTRAQSLFRLARAARPLPAAAGYCDVAGIHVCSCSKSRYWIASSVAGIHVCSSKSRYWIASIADIFFRSKIYGKDRKEASPEDNPRRSAGGDYHTGKPTLCMSRGNMCFAIDGSNLCFYKLLSGVSLRPRAPSICRKWGKQMKI